MLYDELAQIGELELEADLGDEVEQSAAPPLLDQDNHRLPTLLEQFEASATRQGLGRDNAAPHLASSWQQGCTSA